MSKEFKSMTKQEVIELAEIIGTLPNYSEEYHISKYLIIERANKWLEQKKHNCDLNKFGQICWG
jgi:hypothetical protein